MFTTILIALSAIVTIGSAIPYIIGIIRGQTKPRIVSWFIWTVLTGIAAAASFVDGQYPAAILSLCAAVETGLIVILGLRHGDRSFSRLDVVCLLGAVAGLILWFIFNSPAVAVLAVLAIDVIGVIPTLHHSWQHPSEENWLTFLMAAIGGGLTLVVVENWQVTAVAYPLYILLVNLLVAGVILGRIRSAEIRA
jgi:hypothetical protein